MRGGARPRGGPAGRRRRRPRLQHRAAGLLGRLARAGGSTGDVPEDRIRAALTGERERTAESLLAPLRPLAARVRLKRTYGDDMIVNAAFLVDRAREHEFDARVEGLGDENPSIDLRYVGPAPPYTFVDVVVGEEGGRMLTHLSQQVYDRPGA